MNLQKNAGIGFQDEFSELVDGSWAELGSLRGDLNRTISRAIEDLPDAGRLPDATRELPLRGKQLRPLLAFLTNIMCGGPGSTALCPAAAVELVHAASLLHDDVLDNATTRRGIPSFPSQFGDKLSILTGDFFFARALSLLAETGDHAITAAIAEATARISIGDYSQKTLSPTDPRAETSFLAALENKTASLFACACRCGALRTGANAETTDNYARVGTSLGIVYQLSDDVLDIFGSTQVLGKNPGDDLREGTPTLPIIYALNVAVESDRRKLLSLFGSKRPDMEMFRRVLRETGALDYSIEILRKNAEKVESSLARIPIHPQKKTISELSSALVTRAHQAAVLRPSPESAADSRQAV